MASTLLTINTTVPSPDYDGCPMLVFYDNGDWEIAMAGDVGYITDGSASFVGADDVVGLLSLLSLEYDGDEMDINGDEANLFVSITIDPLALDAPVIVLWEDGATEICERITAEKLIETPDSIAFNFIPMADFFDDLRRFIAHKGDILFGHRDDEPFYVEGEDD